MEAPPHRNSKQSYYGRRVALCPQLSHLGIVPAIIVLAPVIRYSTPGKSSWHSGVTKLRAEITHYLA